MPYLGNKTSKFKTADELTVTGDATITGSVYATSYTGDGSALSGINTDLVSDTTPQLGGDLDTNGNDVNFGDNDKAQFGASNDLQIYHNGSNSIVQDGGTGNLQFVANNIDVLSSTFENVAKFNENSDVKLYYDNAEKLATTSTGVDVTGRITTDAITEATNGFVGIGTTSVGRAFHLKNSSPTMRLEDADGAGAYGEFGSDTGGSLYYLADHGNSGSGSMHRFYVDASERMRLTNGSQLLIDAEGGSNLTIDVRQGSAKVWSAHETIGTISTYDSYNQSSLTDLGVARARVTINNNMNNGNYAISGGTSFGYTTYSQFQFDNQDAGQFEAYNSPDYNKNFADGITHATIHGDLA